MSTQNSNGNFLGTGWAFPIEYDRRGAISTVSEEDDVRQAVHIILGTNPGERVMRPDFGAGIRAMLFEPMNTNTLERLKHKTKQALIRWEPRIDNIEVSLQTELSLGKILIEVRYRIRSTNTFYNLVYPLYLTEGTAV